MNDIQKAALKKLYTMQTNAATILEGIPAEEKQNTLVAWTLQKFELLTKWLKALHLGTQLPADAPDDKTDSSLIAYVATIAGNVNSGAFKINVKSMKPEIQEKFALIFKYNEAMWAYIDALRYDLPPSSVP